MSAEASTGRAHGHSRNIPAISERDQLRSSCTGAHDRPSQRGRARRRQHQPARHAASRMPSSDVHPVELARPLLSQSQRGRSVEPQLRLAAAMASRILPRRHRSLVRQNWQQLTFSKCSISRSEEQQFLLFARHNPPMATRPVPAPVSRPDHLRQLIARVSIAVRRPRERFARA